MTESDFPSARSPRARSRNRRPHADGNAPPGPIPWRGLALAQGVWFVTVAVLIAVRIMFWGMVRERLAWNLVFLEATVAITWGILLPFVVLVSLRHPLGRPRGTWVAHLVAFVTAILIEATVYVAVDVTLLHVIPWSPEAGFGFIVRLRNAVVGHFASSVWLYVVIAGTTHAYVYRELFHDRQLRAARLEAQLAQSQLQVLRSQLHPHFLFNSLHAVSTLMHRDAEAADTMLTGLSDLLRASLASPRAHEVPLKEELELLERYVEIERTRFRDRLVVRIEAAPETLDACVPQLLLQPLVENSIRHGIGPRPGPGTVEVRAWRSGEDLRLLVRDDGLGAFASVGDRASGVGLANTRRRLQRLYGRAHRFRASPSRSGGFRVSMRLPYHTEPLAIGGADA